MEVSMFYFSYKSDDLNIRNHKSKKFLNRHKKTAQ